MAAYTREQLAEILELHSKWIVSGGADGSRADLYEADLSEADLSAANLSCANLSRAILSEANLSAAILSEANLYEADLSCANLSCAILSRAILSEANLSRAILSEANLYWANLSRADLSGASHILRGPRLDGYEVFLVRFPDGPRYKAGCRWFTVAQAQEHWRDLSRHCRDDAKRHCGLMLTGLTGLLEVAALLGWEGIPDVR